MKVKLYKLMVGGKFYYGTTTQELRQRFNEHKSWNRWKIDDWTSSTIELIEEFECESKRERDKKEDDILKEWIGNPLCLNERRAFISIEESKVKSREIHKIWRESNKDRVETYTHNRNRTCVKCDTCNSIITLPNMSRHKKICNNIKHVANTDERHIYKTNHGSFQVQINRKDLKCCKNFSTIEEAILFRDSQLSETHPKN
jgi:predicted GIY-YIG superfamily endonuclease